AVAGGIADPIIALEELLRGSPVRLSQSRISRGVMRVDMDGLVEFVDCAFDVLRVFVLLQVPSPSYVSLVRCRFCILANLQLAALFRLNLRRQHVQGRANNSVL